MMVLFLIAWLCIVKDWQNEINSVISFGQEDVVNAAIKHFTGASPCFIITDDIDVLGVVSIGYRCGPKNLGNL